MLTANNKCSYHNQIKYNLQTQAHPTQFQQNPKNIGFWKTNITTLSTFNISPWHYAQAIYLFYTKNI